MWFAGALRVVFSVIAKASNAVLNDVCLRAVFALSQVTICHPRMAIERLNWLLDAALETTLGCHS